MTMTKNPTRFGAAFALAVAGSSAAAADMCALDGPTEYAVGSGAGGSPDVIMRTTRRS